MYNALNSARPEGTKMAEPVNIFEFEQLAKEEIEKGHYDFIAGGPPTR